MARASLVVIVLFAVLSLALAQDDGFLDLRTIDSFDERSENIIIVVPASASFPLSEEETTTGDASDGIFGNERNLLLTVASGLADAVLSTGVSNSDFTCTTPQDATGTTLLQYDGSDNSAVLNPSGLFDVNGLNTNLMLDEAFAFHALMESDQPTSVTFRVYSGSADNFCQFIQELPGDDTLNEYFLNYIEFEAIGSGCDFSNVGAIEVIVDMFENVDVLIEIITTYGPIPTTATPSRTKSPSLTPIPFSNSPTPSVTPPPSDTCVCRCPIFVCEIFRVDDGDYYFYNFGTNFDFFYFIGFMPYFTPTYFVPTVITDYFTPTFDFLFEWYFN